MHTDTRIHTCRRKDRHKHSYTHAFPYTHGHVIAYTSLYSHTDRYQLIQYLSNKEDSLTVFKRNVMGECVRFQSKHKNQNHYLMYRKNDIVFKRHTHIYGCTFTYKHIYTHTLTYTHSDTHFGQISSKPQRWNISLKEMEVETCH